MSDTPETDKKQNWDRPDNVEWKWIVPSSFSRRLERERDEARRELAAAEELHRRRFATLKGEFDFVCARLADAEHERDRMSQMNQHADKSRVSDSTYVLTQPPRHC